VGLLTSGDVFGGAERQVLTLLNELRARGVRAVLLVLFEGFLASEARQMGISVLAFTRRGGLGVVNLPAMISAVKREGLSIIHTHGYKAAVLAALLRLFVRVKCIRTEHGATEPGAGSLAMRTKLLVYELLDRIAVRFGHDAVVYVTEDLRRSSGSCLGKVQQFVIPNGLAVSAMRDRPIPSEYTPGGFRIVMVARLAPVKGLELAIRALLDSRLPPHIHLYILGEGPLESHLASLISSTGLENRVRLLGFRSDPTPYVQHADLMLVSSLHEGLPYSVLEALALGTPVAASKVGGIREHFGESAELILFEPGDSSAIADALQWVLQNPGDVRRMAANSRSVIEQRFGSGLMADRYRAVYEAL
jgi:glycosyltransferase involved in cell wall biosynthesis